MQLLLKGNRQRTQEPTAANQTSSRSHAVLQVAVRQRSRVKNVLQEVRQGRLFMIDLAGSERASQVRLAPRGAGEKAWGAGQGCWPPSFPRGEGGDCPREGGDEGDPEGKGLRNVSDEQEGWGGPWGSTQGLFVGRGLGAWGFLQGRRQWLPRRSGEQARE